MSKFKAVIYMFTLILGILFGLIFTIFSVQNGQYARLNLTPDIWLNVPVYLIAIGFMISGSVLALVMPPVLKYTDRFSGYLGKKKHAEEVKVETRGRKKKSVILARLAKAKEEKEKQKAKSSSEKQRRFFKGISTTPAV